MKFEENYRFSKDLTKLPMVKEFFNSRRMLRKLLVVNMNFNEWLVVSGLFAHKDWKDIEGVLEDLYEVTILIISLHSFS